MEVFYMKFTQKTTIAFLSLGLLLTSFAQAGIVEVGMFKRAIKGGNLNLAAGIFSTLTDSEKQSAQTWYINVQNSSLGQLPVFVQQVQPQVVTQPVVTVSSDIQLPVMSNDQLSNEAISVLNTGTVQKEDGMFVYEEPTSYFGTKTKVALGVLGTAAVIYGGYKLYQRNPEAFMSSLDKVKNGGIWLKDTTFSGVSKATNWVTGLFSKPEVTMSKEEIKGAVDTIMNPLIELAKSKPETGFILVGEGKLETAVKPVKIVLDAFGEAVSK